MNDQQILDLVSRCTNQAITEGYHIVSDVLNIEWEVNRWVAIGNICCPLSAVLLIDDVMPDILLSKSDDLRYATICKLFGHGEFWLKSVMSAISGDYNSGSSISGYMLGRKIRKSYLV